MQWLQIREPVRFFGVWLAESGCRTGRFALFLFSGPCEGHKLDQVNVRERKISQLVATTIEDLGCELWGVELHSGGKHSKLCIYIDRAEGVTVHDCEQVSRSVSDLLDVEDLLPDRYTLEVSSPGMDRILFRPDQYQGAVGERVDLRLSVPFEKRKRIQGLLVGVENDEAVVRVDDEEYVLPIEGIARARVVPQHSFGNAKKPVGGRKGRDHHKRQGS